MLNFHIISLLPEVFDDYLSSSVLGRAKTKKIISFKSHNLRDWAVENKKTNKKDWSYNKVDDSPYGGGPGMVLMVEPIFRAVSDIKKKIIPKVSSKNTRVILFSTRGKVFNQEDAKRLSKYKNIIFVCGRYEGVDERVAQYVADEEISIGDFILSGGELPAMIVIDAVSRQVKGVLGKNESLEELKGSYPVYTRPEEFIFDKKKTKNKWSVPEVLLSGNHKKINEWRGQN